MLPTDLTSGLTADKLRALLTYEPDTGLFRWRVWRPNGVKVGDVAGSLNRTTGYWTIKIEGRGFQASRLAWLYTTGEWPTARIDHEDLDRVNNRWSNLRAATMTQNAANRAVHKRTRSGLKGAHYIASGNRAKRWAANIRVDGVLRHLGNFLTPEEAHGAYTQAAHEVFGQFARS